MYGMPQQPTISVGRVDSSAFQMVRREEERRAAVQLEMEKEKTR